MVTMRTKFLEWKLPMNFEKRRNSQRFIFGRLSAGFGTLPMNHVELGTDRREFLECGGCDTALAGAGGARPVFVSDRCPKSDPRPSPHSCHAQQFEDIYPTNVKRRNSWVPQLVQPARAAAE